MHLTCDQESSRINRNGNLINLNVWSILTLDKIEFEKNNIMSLKKKKFAFIIPNPSLDCFLLVLNFWSNLSLVVLIKLFLHKKK